MYVCMYVHTHIHRDPLIVHLYLNTFDMDLPFSKVVTPLICNRVNQEDKSVRSIKTSKQTTSRIPLGSTLSKAYNYMTYSHRFSAIVDFEVSFHNIHRQLFSKGQQTKSPQGGYFGFTFAATGFS